MRNVTIIPIPHLTYEVRVICSSKLHKNPACRWISKARCDIEMHVDKLTPDDAPTLAHEAMHACQFIAEDRGIDMIREQEHVAYLIQYIMRRAYKLKSIVI